MLHTSIIREIDDRLDIIWEVKQRVVPFEFRRNSFSVELKTLNRKFHNKYTVILNIK